MKLIDEQELIETVLSVNLSRKCINDLVQALTFKRYIISAVLPFTPESETFGHFLERFWDYDSSPYIREKQIVGQIVHRRYADIMLSRARTYWIPKFGSRTLGSISLNDIKKHLQNLACNPQKVYGRKMENNGKRAYKVQMLSSETVNQIVRSATCALKWAYHNNLTKNDCFSGIVYCHVSPKPRRILSMSEAIQVFSASWENPMYRLANLCSACTGMRIGEVQALQFRDIGKDRIYVRHNWARLEGLKCPKNGEEREIRVSKKIIHELVSLMHKNPYGFSEDNFVFWGYKKTAPCQGRHWNEALHKVVSELNISDWQNVSFHGWRHFFASNMADFIDERKLQLATGHKSRYMLKKYASHESEQTLDELGNVSEKLFKPLVSTNFHVEN
ncbi:MAG: tyrosine-type recombinase/integrase [Treponema sp.]|nr:tyrosine-type recombinase/integrase [Treponema sp.]